jgi:hypothetical protein
MIVIQPEGLGEAQALLKMISKIGKIKPYVEYRGTERSDGKANNAEMLHWHALEGRDVVSMEDGSPELKNLQQTVLDVVERRIKREQKTGFLRVTKRGKIVGTGQKITKTLAKTGKKKTLTAEKKARAIAASAYKKVEWKLEISERIREQRNADGSQIRDLTPDYAEAKKKKHGFTRPVLVATGDLLDSITGTMAGIRYKEQGK